jgi:hypothetical protein
MTTPETLCQEFEPDRPYAPDWIVSRIALTNDARHSVAPLKVYYPFFVEGHLADDNTPFSWIVPSIADWRYDLTNASYDDDVLRAFGLDDITIVDLFDGE